MVRVVEVSEVGVGVGYEFGDIVIVWMVEG